MKSIFAGMVLLAVLATACDRLRKPAFNAVSEEAAIRAVIHAEQVAWNNGDMEAFMAHYWKSDSLQLMSPRGINHGWEATLDAYKQGYPDRAAMGTLSLDIDELIPLPPAYFLVTGKYKVTQATGTVEGVFTLVFRKVNGLWVAIHDHHS